MHVHFYALFVALLMKLLCTLNVFCRPTSGDIINWASLCTRGRKSDLHMPSYSKPTYYGLQVCLTKCDETAVKLYAMKNLMLFLSGMFCISESLCVFHGAFSMYLLLNVCLVLLVFLGGQREVWSYRVQERVYLSLKLTTRSSPSLCPAKCLTLWAAPTSVY